VKDGRGEYFDSFGRRPSAEFERYMDRHCRYWTLNDKQLQSVVSQFCGPYCICYRLYRSSGIDMRKIVCSFTSDTALNDVLVHALVCIIGKNTNAFQMHKRFLYSTCTRTHTHTLYQWRWANVRLLAAYRRTQKSSYPFLLEPYRKRLKRCAGCMSEFQHDPPTFAVSKREWHTYFYAARQCLSWCKMFYHYRTSCIIRRYPDFGIAKVVVNLEL